MKNPYLFPVIILAITALATPSFSGSINFAWDRNAETSVIGYKIYYGKVSRLDKNLDPAAIVNALVDKYCAASPECAASWREYCTDSADPLCDKDYFGYENTVDVENVTEYEITDLPAGMHYFTIVAYREKLKDGQINLNQESKFAVEKSHDVPYTKPECTLPVGHNDYCRDCGPCAVGEGDCDTDDECQGSLICPQVSGTDVCQLPKSGDSPASPQNFRIIGGGDGK